MSSAAEDTDLWPAAPDRDPGAALMADIQAELTELRGIAMRFARRLDAAAETIEGQDDLARLNNAAVKAARAVRQVAVLQLEIAGLRSQPGTRPAAAPANQNAPKSGTKPHVNGPRPYDNPWAHGDYTEYDDYDDWDLKACRSAMFRASCRRLDQAIHDDLAAHGREDVRDAGPAKKMELVRAIPHPALDACIQDIDLSLIRGVFGKGNVTVSLEPAAMDCWAAYDAEKARDGDRRDTS